MITETADRRALLRDRIADIVLADGLGAFALRGLAARLGTSGRMLLYYFGSKDVLVRETLQRISDRMAAILAGHAADAPPATPGGFAAAILQRAEATDIAPFMRIWTEVVSAAARGETPFVDVAPGVVAGWIAWTDARLRPEHRGTGVAVALLAAMDGLTLLELASPGITATARALLPALLDAADGDSHSAAPILPNAEVPTMADPHTPPPSTLRPIVGSARALPAGAVAEGAVPDGRVVEASLGLRPRDETALLREIGALADPNARRVLMAHARAELYGDDIRAVVDYANEHGLTVLETSAARRLVRVSGEPKAIEAAFGTRLGVYRAGAETFRTHSGELHLPEQLHGVVESVLGLDDRAVAHTRIVRPMAAQPGGIEPNKLGPLYDFPTGVTGAGVTIALIELGGGFSASDNKAAFKAMGLKVPRVVAVSVDGARNKTGSDADGEVALDIQVAGGLAPGAEIAVYFAPNTDAGFSDAISQAAHDATTRPSVISISWGGPESSWSSQAVTAMNGALQDAAALGISVYVASGDSLATDGVDDGMAHVDFPASSPYATGCGGTHIAVSGSTISAEMVWNDSLAGGGGTGGGISDLFPVPAFQTGVPLPASVNGGRKGRGVPDVAGDAAPGSGYLIVVGGKKEVVGGTSAVAPLWAGLTALINQTAKVPVGFLPDFLYAQVQAGRALTVEITSGNNKPANSQIGYQAGPTWNACTGLGRPDGNALFAALTARTAATAVSV